MRTTIDIDDELLRQAKRVAAERGVSLRTVVQECLARGLAQRDPKPRPFGFKSHPGRPLGAIDFADRDRLYEVMDGPP